MSLENNTTKLQNLLQKAQNLPNAGSGELMLQEKSVSPSTSTQTVTPDVNYNGLSKVTVNAIPSEYENVGAETSAYTTELSELEAQISALESALEGKASGGGSSSGGLETCTARIIDPLWSANAMIYFVSIIDGEFRFMRELIGHGSEYNNVPCNSDLYIDGSFDYINVTSEDGSSYYDGYEGENWGCYRVHVGTSDTVITFS